MNGTALIPKVMEANAAGIPVITADTRVDDGPAVVETFVGLDERSSFAGMAEWVVAEMGGEGEVAILEGFRGSSTAELRLQGMMDVFDSYEGIEVVASIAADWDQEKGLKAAEDILQANPGVDAIIGSNDLMALGAVQAVNGAGKADDIIVVSFAGGRGIVLTALVGALIMAMITNGLNILGISSFYQQVLIGIVIIVAVWLDNLKSAAR